MLLNTPFTLKPQVAVFSDDSADAKGLIAKIKKHKVKVGIAIRPGTPVEQLIPFCHDIDLALVMTVDPGFGGQPFMGDMMEKVLFALMPGKNTENAIPSVGYSG